MNKNIKEIYTKLYENLPVGIELYDEDGFLVDINKKGSSDKCVVNS